jgi:hypothetical protein
MLLILAILGASAQDQVVGAAQAPDFNAQIFRPTIDGRRTLWTDDATRGGHNQGTARLLFHYTDSPLVYEYDDGTTVDIVKNVVQGDVLAGYAYDRLRVGIDLPVYLYAAGNNGSEAGLGDLALDAKVTVVDGENAPLNIALNGRMNLPTNTVATSLGDPNVGWEVAAIADRSFGPVMLAANVGTRGGPKTELENISLNDAFLYRAGLGYAIRGACGSGRLCCRCAWRESCRVAARWLRLRLAERRDPWWLRLRPLAGHRCTGLSIAARGWL